MIGMPGCALLAVFLFETFNSILDAVHEIVTIRSNNSK